MIRRLFFRFTPLALLVLGPWLAAAGLGAQPFDVVLSGARVIDPETGLDALRDVGVAEDRIAAVSASPLASSVRPGGVVIDARGLVLAPGFIDLHAHGQSRKANEYQARDGVTTALELEWGYSTVGQWLAAKSGKALIHFGASVAHGMLRTLALSDGEGNSEALLAAAQADEPLLPFQRAVRDAFYQPLPEGRTPRLRALLAQGLREGGLGIGMAHQYTPGADRREILRVFEFAAERQAPIFTHVRSMGLEAIQEVVANAAATGAPLHIVHVNSSSLGDLPVVLELIAGAQRRGHDVTTEAYPYTAGSTSIESSIFDPGWQERLGISYGDVQWQDTGERLSEETFNRYRAQGGIVILHMMKEEMIDLAMATPFVMVASDGMPYAPGAHPRSAGTFARVLGRYVRERGALTLPDAIRRMTLLPALRLESIAPGMKKKGRVQAGMDADLVVFDPATVTDTATFASGPSYSLGIQHVLVAGTFVVRDGALVPDVSPGRPVVSRFRER